jgi:hypothetical protein
LQEKSKAVLFCHAKFLHLLLGGTKVKTLLNKCAVAILTLTLAVSASAGQIQCPGVTSGGGTTSTTDITTTVILTATSLVS